MKSPSANEKRIQGKRERQIFNRCYDMPKLVSNNYRYGLHKSMVLGKETTMTNVNENEREIIEK